MSRRQRDADLHLTHLREAYLRSALTLCSHPKKVLRQRTGQRGSTQKQSMIEVHVHAALIYKYNTVIIKK